MLASWKNIRLSDLLKLSADVRNLKGNGRLLLKEKYCLNKFTRFAHCLRTLLGSPQRCLPLLHSWTVAKTASQQENQIDEKKIGDIWRLLFQNVCFIYLRVDLGSVSFSCRETQQSKCEHASVQTVLRVASHGSWRMQPWPSALGLVAALLVKPRWSASAHWELGPCGRGIKRWSHSESSRSGDKSGRRRTGRGDECPRIKGSLMSLLSHSVTSPIFIPGCPPWHSLMAFKRELC